MIKKGEYLFETFEEALIFVNKPTNYEKINNIGIIKTEVVLNLEDVKLVCFHKSDNTKTIFLFFRNSTRYDIWKFWCPSEKQFEALKSIPFIYQYVNKVNEEGRDKQ